LRVKFIQVDFQWNGKFQLPIYADGDNILGGNVLIVKENVESLVDASKESGLEVNANKTKCMVLYRDQIGGWRHSAKIEIISLEIDEEL